MSDSNGIPLMRLERPVEIFASFGNMPLPDALEGLLFRIRAMDAPSGIERFACQSFNDVDLRRLRALMLKVSVRFGRDEVSGRFFLAFDGAQVAERDRVFLLSIEAAINRVQSVLTSLGFGVQPATSSPSLEDCSLIELSILNGVASGAEPLLQKTDQPNPWMRLGSGAAEAGGEWDIRSRFAMTCEALDIVVRLDYSFDCLATAGMMRIRFSAPDGSEMPQRLFDAEVGRWREPSQVERHIMAKEYGYRTALVLAAAGFASGMLIRRCSLEMRDRVRTGATIRLQFERAEFLGSYLEFARALDGELLDGAAARRLADAMVKRVAPLRGATARKRPPGQDDRALPAGLRDLLLADTASDLEVMEPPGGPDRVRVDELKLIARTDPQRALLGLNELVERLEVACVAVELLSEVPLRSEFCENHIGRIIAPLLEDDRATRIHRVPDALYFARYEIATIYMRDGDLDQALGEARRLLDLAPTSMQAHFTLINVLGSLGRYEELVDVAKHGLNVAFDADPAAYLFYRIAFSLWRLGRHDQALACYCQVPADDHFIGNVRREAALLMREMGVSPPSQENAEAALVEAGIPVPPTDRLRRQLSDSLVLLADNGFHFLACRCAFFLSDLLGGREMGALSESFS